VWLAAAWRWWCGWFWCFLCRYDFVGKYPKGYSGCKHRHIVDEVHHRFCGGFAEAKK